MTKKKPGPKGWASPEQWDLLAKYCADFRIAQGTKGEKNALDDFWKKIIDLFLEMFPIEEGNPQLLKFWCTVCYFGCGHWNVPDI